MEKSNNILKYFLMVTYINVFFLGMELVAAYIERKPMKIILIVNINCFVILLILTIIRLIRKDYELPMYSTMLLFGCSVSWVMPILLYGSIFGKNTGIVTGILYVISVGIGISIPVLQGRVDRNKPFWIAIRRVVAIFTVSIVSVLIVLGRLFGGSRGRIIMRETMSTSATGKLMWGLVLFVSMILGGFSVFCMIGISQNPNSEFNQKRKRLRNNEKE